MPKLFESSLAPLIVCERTGDWAVALRRALVGSEIPLRETRSLIECDDQLSANPASCVFVALDAGRTTDVVDFVMAWSDRFARCHVVIGAPRHLAHYEPLLREAGAIHFVTSPRDLATTAAILTRHAQATSSVG